MDAEQQQRILGYFIEEAKDHLNVIEQGLQDFQATQADAETMNELFRAAHSIKGGAAMLDLGGIQRIAHKLEDSFKVFKEGNAQPVHVEVESLLRDGLQGLQQLLQEVEHSSSLTPATEQTVLQNLEPVFATLGEHLGLSQITPAPSIAKTTAPVQSATPPVHTSVASSPPTTPTPAQQDNTFQIIFRNDVSGTLRQMLQIFKRADQPESRQQLLELCQTLEQVGERFNLPQWCDLVRMARSAIAADQNTYHTLAPIIIKDLKKAQDQVLLGQYQTIEISQDLQDLVPEPAVDTDILSDNALNELLGSIDQVSLSEDLDLSFLTAGEDESVAATQDADDQSLTATDQQFDTILSEFGQPEQPASSLELASELIDDPATTSGHTGPEVGLEELNTLADLFGGEVSDLGLGWDDTSEFPDELNDIIASSPSSEEDDISDFLLDSDTASTDPPLDQAVDEFDELLSLFDSLDEQVSPASSPASSPKSDADRLTQATGNRDDNASELLGSLEFDLDMEAHTHNGESSAARDLGPLNSEASGASGSPGQSDAGVVNRFDSSTPEERSGSSGIDRVLDELDALTDLTSSDATDSLEFRENFVDGSRLGEDDQADQSLEALSSDFDELDQEDGLIANLDLDLDLIASDQDWVDAESSARVDVSANLDTPQSAHLDSLDFGSLATDLAADPLTAESDLSLASELAQLDENLNQFDSFLIADEHTAAPPATETIPGESVAQSDPGLSVSDDLSFDEILQDDLTFDQNPEQVMSNLPNDESHQIALESDLQEVDFEDAVGFEANALDAVTNDVDFSLGFNEISAEQPALVMDWEASAEDREKDVTSSIESTDSPSNPPLEFPENSQLDSISDMDFLFEPQGEVTDSLIDADSNEDFAFTQDNAPQEIDAEWTDFFGENTALTGSALDAPDTEINFFQDFDHNSPDQPIHETEQLSGGLQDATALPSLATRVEDDGSAPATDPASSFTDSSFASSNEIAYGMSEVDHAEGLEIEDLDGDVASHWGIDTDLSNAELQVNVGESWSELDAISDSFDRALEDNAREDSPWEDNPASGYDGVEEADKFNPTDVEPSPTTLTDPEHEFDLEWLDLDTPSSDSEPDRGDDNFTTGLDNFDFNVEQSLSEPLEDSSDSLDSLLEFEPLNASLAETEPSIDTDSTLEDFPTINPETNWETDLESIDQSLLNVANSAPSDRDITRSTASESDDLLDSNFDQLLNDDWGFDFNISSDSETIAPETTTLEGEGLDLLDTLEGLDDDLDALLVDNASPQPDTRPAPQPADPLDLGLEGFDDLDNFLEQSPVQAIPTPANLAKELEGLDTLLVDSASQDGMTLTDEELEGLDTLLVDSASQDGMTLTDLEAGEFDDLDNLLLDAGLTDLATSSAPTDELDALEFDDLDALLDFAPTDPPQPTEPKSAPPPSIEDDFGDMAQLLRQAEMMGGPPMPTGGGRIAAQPAPRRAARVEQNMRVPVKQLDNLNNLVGEMVVNRNSLETDQDRLRQSLDKLLYQVQQLSDVGQRLQDLYERSLLENALLASRQAFQGGGSISHPAALASNGGAASEDEDFDALEMDRFSGFHLLSQEMIELIVRVRESASDIEYIVNEPLDYVTRNFRQITTQLQEGLTRTRMVPFEQTANRLPRAVRDISKKCGKQAKLLVEGKDTLIDKMLLEQLYDPMTHLVNNAVTHGIEFPDERRKSGKESQGTVRIQAFHQGNQTVISVSDDGAGIDAERVRRKAIEKRLISRDEAITLPELQLYDFLFHPGFSTRDKADDFAGRGVGMDVVRTRLQEIRGTITIDSTRGEGTTFTIRLPLTLSISKALCCISHRARVAFPMDGVEDMLDVPEDRVQMNEQGQPSIQWRDQLMTFRPLSELLKYSRLMSRSSVYGGTQDDEMLSVVILRSAGEYLALQVDRVEGEKEIVIKQLEGPVPKPSGIAGVTVLSDGQIMPIADVLELIDISKGRSRQVGTALWEQEQPPASLEEPDAPHEPVVLIVDDSITVRELLSMSFNKSGYRVEQARDGQEAWEKLRSGLPCDIVFCDIEMPRMTGLELLEKLQKDETLANLPIAMLTSRGADRHRQMAVQLGARGYFTKPYLEEALLEAASRMLKGEVLVTASP